MLMRILADNPGPTFTRNIDKDFAATVKELLRYGRDPSVKQILMETLDNFEREKKEDTNLKVLMEMWKKEQEKMQKVYGSGRGVSFHTLQLRSYKLTKTQGNALGQRTLNAPPFDPHSQNYFSRSHNTSRGLPNPHELASRIEEARTSAKLLTQVVQSTPPTEFLQNELIKEFADRCQSASRSIQGYITSQNPAPDNDTMLTLIETNEQLALAISKYQRAVLQTRRSLGLGTDTPSPSAEAFAPPPGPPPGSFSQVQPPPGPPPSKGKPPVPSRKSLPSPPNDAASNSNSRLPEVRQSEGLEDPFKDPSTSTTRKVAPPEIPTDEFSGMGIEPYHPGFNPTQSYVGRQDSAVGNTTMHAAGADRGGESEEEDDGYAPPAQQTRKAPVYRY
jgi:hypothetical protein